MADATEEKKATENVGSGDDAESKGGDDAAEEEAPVEEEKEPEPRDVMSLMKAGVISEGEMTGGDDDALFLADDPGQISKKMMKRMKKGKKGKKKKKKKGEGGEGGEAEGDAAAGGETKSTEKKKAESRPYKGRLPKEDAGVEAAARTPAELIALRKERKRLKAEKKARKKAERQAKKANKKKDKKKKQLNMAQRRNKHLEKKQRKLARIRDGMADELERRKQEQLKRNSVMRTFKVRETKVKMGKWRLDDEGRMHRKGKYIYPDGSSYDGEWVDGERDGHGVMESVNGAKYTGGYRKGLIHGRGVMEYEPIVVDFKMIKGRKYTGTFNMGLREGTGKYEFGNGDFYEGEWAADRYHGQGTRYWHTGEKYVGSWVRGNRTGYGTMYFANGDVFTGDWSFGRFHGFGEWKAKPLATGMSGGWYRGQYIRGYQDGKAAQLYTDGSRFEGTFHEGQRLEGRVERPNGEVYEGAFAHGGQFWGQGTLYHITGDVYNGEWRNGVPWGEGKYTYKDGSTYFGDYRARTGKKKYKHGCTFPLTDGKRVGKGKRVWTTGSVYNGAFDDNLPEGKGTYKGRDGTRITGMFSRGHAHGEAKGSWRAVGEDPSIARDAVIAEQTYVCPMGNEHAARKPCPAHLRGVAEEDLEESERESLRNQCTYEGQWKRGMFDGDGEFRCCDGRCYVGQWKEGRRHGQGTQVMIPDAHRGTDPKRQFIGGVGSLYRPWKYSGQWENGQRTGRGALSFAGVEGKQNKSNRIEGNFVNGHPDGVVTHIYVNRDFSETGKQALYRGGRRLKWLKAEDFV